MFKDNFAIEKTGFFQILTRKNNWNYELYLRRENFNQRREICQSSNFILLKEYKKEKEIKKYFIEKINGSFIYVKLNENFERIPLKCQYFELNGKIIAFFFLFINKKINNFKMLNLFI